MLDLEALLPAEHRARVVWSFVDGLDLAALYERIRAREGEPGRPPPDPKLLLALWLYATLEGVGSARQLERLCESDLAYRWLCGGVPVNYHGLSDFRVGCGEVLEALLTQSLTALLAAGVVSLDEVAVDGTKVRAHASKASFRRAPRLDAIEAAARERVASLKQEIAADPAASERRRRAAQLRGAQAVADRAAAAKQTLEKMQAERAANAKKHPQAEAEKDEPRASRTDPEARKMRFADGAVRPGYNVQLAIDPASNVVLAVEVSDRRNDAGFAARMVEQVKARLKAVPRRLLADTHYATSGDIVALAAAGVEVYAPPPAQRPNASGAAKRRREHKRAKEPQAVREWRQRMADEASTPIYRRRLRIETTNAVLKQRGLGVMRVRSLAKATCVALLHALAHNLWRQHCLRPAHA
jgi:transposase